MTDWTKRIVFAPRAAHGQEYLITQRFGTRVEIVDPESMVPAAEEVGALITLDSLGLPPGFLERATNLEWVHVQTHGFDKVLTPEFAAHQATLTNTRLLADPVSEHAFAMLLSLVRRLPAVVLAQQEHRWQRVMCDSLSDKTMCIVGAGAIGSAVAKRAKAFGMRVIGVNRTPKPQQWVDQAVGTGGLDGALSQSDVVVVILPASPSTKGLIDSRRLSLIKRGGYLINVGRGGVVDEEALGRLLQDGHLSGAGLDVFDTEPLPANSPLWDMPNVIVSPHIAGFSEASRKLLVEFANDQIERYLKGEPLRNVVKPGAAR